MVENSHPSQVQPFAIRWTIKAHWHWFDFESRAYVWEIQESNMWNILNSWAILGELSPKRLCNEKSSNSGNIDSWWIYWNQANVWLDTKHVTRDERNSQDICEVQWTSDELWRGSQSSREQTQKHQLKA